MPDDKPLGDAIRDALLHHLGVSSESLQKIKLGRGAVGKITTVAVVALIAIGAIGFRISGTLWLFGVIGVLALITVASLLAILYVIIKQPELAVLEGAELIRYKQVTLGMKGHPILPPSGPPIPEPPPLPSEHSPEEAQ
jgi:hypothetical protein